MDYWGSSGIVDTPPLGGRESTMLAALVVFGTSLLARCVAMTVVPASVSNPMTSWNPEPTSTFNAQQDTASMIRRCRESSAQTRNHRNGRPWSDASGDAQTREQTLAAPIEEHLSGALDEQAPITAPTCPLINRHSWPSTFSPRPDRPQVRTPSPDLPYGPALTCCAIIRTGDSPPGRSSQCLAPAVHP